MSPPDASDRELQDLEERTQRLGDDIAKAKADLVDPDGDSTLENEVEGAVGDHPERSEDEPEADGAPKGWA